MKTDNLFHYYKKIRLHCFRLMNLIDTSCKLRMFMLVSLTFSCEDFLHVDAPKTGLISRTVFSSDATAMAAVSAIYSKMVSSFLGTTAVSVTVLNGLSADELLPPSSIDQNYQQFFQNSILPTNTFVSSAWGNGYNFIYQANSILEGVSMASAISPDVKKQIEGEAKFIRAYCHFYLTNLYGDVPYISTTDFRVNNISVRTLKGDIYDRVIDDLLDAKSKLKEDYYYSGHQRVRPNKWVASSLLSRVYLFAEKWQEAEAQADEVIAQTELYSLTDLDNVFLKNSVEAIWQWMPAPGQNAGEGSSFILTGAPTIASLSHDLVDAFEEGDLRKEKWVGTFSDGTNVWYFSHKYKQKNATPLSVEYSTIFRLAEQFLIRSEARAQQNNLSASILDLDIIRKRAQLPLISDENPSISREDLLLAIENERRVELFTEYAHRWFDLKRNGRADTILDPVKTGWNSDDVLLPIPESELLVNSNLKPQNSGY